jgi:putative transposase
VVNCLTLLRFQLGGLLISSTFSQIYIQTVFAVSNRQSLIRPQFKEDLSKYITGIVKKQGQKLISINGVADHVHILIGLRPSMALADLVRDIKADSTTYINKSRSVRGRFTWQEGYGAFSYGHSQLDTIIKYIQNQEKHHRRKSFKNEYLSFLRKFDIAFDDKYVFEFID